MPVPGRMLLAASLLAATAATATCAWADETDPPSDFTLSGYVQGVTDYRFRGISDLVAPWSTVTQLPSRKTPLGMAIALYRSPGADIAGGWQLPSSLVNPLTNMQVSGWA